MSKQSNRYISVFIPTFNGEKYLSECIEAILNQQLPEGYSMELLVTDSGSSDNTITILEEYKDKIKLRKIPNKEFSHGRVRQQAAEDAKGEFILFLTQDATPAHYRWLLNMVEPFFISDKVGCVFGRQTPRPNVAPTIKREVSSVFGALGASDSLVVHRHISLVDGEENNPINTFFSDANSAVRRSLLIGDIPFRDIHYAEDQKLAEDMQKNGYLKVYAPCGEVWHSNEYTASEYFRRKFDEYIGLHESTGYNLTASIKSLCLGWIRPTINDYKFIFHDHSYGPRSKIKWYALAPLYNIGSKAGLFFAAKKINDKKFRDKYSLESAVRNKTK